MISLAYLSGSFPVCLSFSFALYQRFLDCLDFHLCQAVIFCCPWEGVLMLKGLLMMTSLNLDTVQDGQLSESGNLRPDTYFAKHMWGSVVRAFACVLQTGTSQKGVQCPTGDCYQKYSVFSPSARFKMCKHWIGYSLWIHHQLSILKKKNQLVFCAY